MPCFGADVVAAPRRGQARDFGRDAEGASVNFAGRARQIRTNLPHPVISFFKPAGPAERLPVARIDSEYRRLRWQVFAGIFVGYAAFYLVRNNLALAMPDILKQHPEYSKAQLGSALTGLALAYGLSKFVMGAVSDRS